MIRINLFYKDKNNLMETGTFSSDRVSNIDDARVIIIKYLNGNYSDVKYKINVNYDFKQNSNSINITFDEHLSIKREFILKQIFND